MPRNKSVTNGSGEKVPVSARVDSTDHHTMSVILATKQDPQSETVSDYLANAIRDRNIMIGTASNKHWLKQWADKRRRRQNQLNREAMEALDKAIVQSKASGYEDTDLD